MNGVERLMVELSGGFGNLTVVAFSVASLRTPAELEYVGEVVDQLMHRIRVVEPRVFRVMHAEAAVATAALAENVRAMISEQALATVQRLQIKGVSVACPGAPTAGWLDDVFGTLGAKHNYGCLDDPSARWLLAGSWRYRENFRMLTTLEQLLSTATHACRTGISTVDFDRQFVALVELACRPEIREDFERILIAALDNDSLPLELIEYSVHCLPSTRVKAVVEERVATAPPQLLRWFTSILEAFDPTWEGRIVYPSLTGAT